MEAAASVIGVVSFGLGLAKSLQAFIDSVIEAEETITLIVAEVNNTTSTLKRLQDLIEQDKAASEQERRATVFNEAGVKEIDACALQCQKIYVQIIILIEKASMQAGEDGPQDTGPRAPVPDDLSTPMVRLAAFNKNVTKLGRKMRWPWLEPRIKRCQEHLAGFKFNLMISLQVFLIAESRARYRPSVTGIFGTDDEKEMRDRAETLRKKVTEMRAKKSPPKQSNRQPRGSDNGASEEADGSSTTSTSIIINSVDSSSSSEILSGPSASSSSSSVISDASQRPRRSRTFRGSRATRTLRAFKVHIWKKFKRKSVFKKDSTSVTFEAYLIYPSPGPWNPSPPPIKLPFGHRRLTREVKRALRKCNPWDILLILRPDHRLQVDGVVQQVQLAATGSTNVCLIAIDVDGLTDANISDLQVEDLQLSWTRMVLFFRHDPVQARERTTETGKDVNGGRHRFTAAVRGIFLSNHRKNKKRLDLQETQRREREEKTSAEKEREQQELQDKVEAEITKRDAETRARQEEERISQEKQIKHDKRIADEARSQLLEKQRQDEDDKRRQQEEREELEEKIRNELRVKEMKAQQEREEQARKDAEAALEAIEKGIGEEELKEMSEAERVKKMYEAERAKRILEDERAKMKAEEERAAAEKAAEKKAAEKKAAEEKAVAEEAAAEKAAADKAKAPLRFRDAVGRKFNFPFHLVQTWMGMEDLIKQAFLHVEVIGPHVQEGHYDLIDSEGQIILPSLWSATVKPGDAVSMRMWPADKPPGPVPQHQHMTPDQRMQFEMMRRAAAQGRSQVLPMRPPPGFTAGAPAFGGPPPPPPGMRPFPLPSKRAAPPMMVDVVDGGRPRKTKGKKAKRPLGFFSGTRPSKKGKAKVVTPRHDEDSEGSEKGENLEDIDKELGLDDLEEAEQAAAKDIDELLETWTNVGGGT